MNQETRIQQSTPEIASVANIADKDSRKIEVTSGGRGSFSGTNRGGNNYRGGRGRGRGRQPWNNNRTFCQICGRPGHVAYKCYNRFDATFQGPSANNNSSNPALFYSSPDSNGVGSEWLMDSGATNPVTPDQSNLSKKSEYYGGEQLRVGNGQGLHIKNIGSSHCGNLVLNKILHVPSVTKNLLSIAQLTSDNNALVEFNSRFVFVKDKATGKILLQGKLRDGLYKVSLPETKHANPNSSHLASFFAALSHVQLSKTCFPKLSSIHLWHFRLGHPSSLILNKVFQQCRTPLSVNQSSTSFCSSCQLGKSHRLYASSSTTKSTAPLQLVFSDVWGPAPIETKEGYKYYVLFEDNYSRFCWAYLMKHKFEVKPIFLQFKLMVENLTNHKIKTIQSDWGVNIVHSLLSLPILE